MQTPVRESPRQHRPAMYAAGAASAIIVAGFVVPLVVAAHYHALGIPRSDDWSYLLSEFRWVDSGRLSFNHWVSMSLVGQLVLAAPISIVLPRDIGALQVLTAVLGTVGLFAVWIGARLAGIDHVQAALLALTIAVGPLWAPLAVSFMTDVPAFALSSVACALALVGIARRPAGFGWICASIATAAVACTVRQYAVVTVLAVLVASWIAIGEPRGRRALLGVGVATFIGLALFLLWWSTVPDGRSLSPAMPGAHAASVFFSKGAGFLRLSGVLLLPVLLAARPVGRLRAAWRSEPALTLVVGFASATWVAVAGVRVAADVFVGNYIAHDGTLSDIVLVGRRPDVLTGPVWSIVVALGSVAGVLLAILAAHGAVAAARRLRRPHSAADPITVLLALSVVGYLGVYVVAMLTGIQVYDRYLLPVLPAAGMLLLRSARPERYESSVSMHRRPITATAACAALIGLAALGVAFGTDSASFDGARWRAAEAAVARGWPAREVNGGFEWRNFHRGDLLLRGRSGEPICVTVHVNPLPMHRPVVAVVESTAPTRRPARLVAYRTRARCEPPRR